MPTVNFGDVAAEVSADSFEVRTQMLPAIFPKKFWTTYDNNPADVLNPTPVDWVCWGKRGDKDYQKEEKVSRVQRDMRQHWQVIKPYYEHWKTGQELPVNGVPLKELPGVTEDMLERFRQLHIRTIEDASQMGEEAIHKIGFGARDLKERATVWLQKRPNRETDSKVTALEAKLAEALSMLQAVQVPKKRGRKPKAQVKEAAE